MNAAACTSETRPSKSSPIAASTASAESSMAARQLGEDRREDLVHAAHEFSPTRCRGRAHPGDQPELYLRRALDDRELPGVPVVELGQVVLHVAGRAEHLQRLARDLHRDLARVVLRHREERHVLLRVLAFVGHGRGAVREQARRFDLGRELGDLPLDALHVGDRLAERGALLHVLDRVHRARPRRARSRAPRRPGASSSGRASRAGSRRSRRRRCERARARRRGSARRCRRRARPSCRRCARRKHPASSARR